MKKLLALCAVIIPLNACVETPKEPKIEKSVWLDQGWSKKESHWFHHVSQGTATFPIPYELFMELEQPVGKDTWFKGLVGEENKFRNPEYLH